jgi:hypothetical protein
MAFELMAAVEGGKRYRDDGGVRMGRPIRVCGTSPAPPRVEYRSSRCERSSTSSSILIPRRRRPPEHILSLELPKVLLPSRVPQLGGMPFLARLETGHGERRSTAGAATSVSSAQRRPRREPDGAYDARIGEDGGRINEVGWSRRRRLW